MTVQTSLHAGAFQVVRDTIVAFSTDSQRKSFNLVPSQALKITGRSVTFSKFNTGLYYSTYYFQSGPIWQSGCNSYISLLGQEWGPDKSNVIADELLGTLPIKADYVDIQIKLTRTKAPTNYLFSSDSGHPGLGMAWPQYLPDGQWVNIDGYSTLVEGINNQVQRSLEFVFDTSTGNISLRKRMSVNGSATSFITTTNPSTFGFYAPPGQNSGIPYTDRDSKAYAAAIDPGGVYLPTGSQHCAQDDNTDSSSVYSMDAVITPGRISAAP